MVYPELAEVIPLHSVHNMAQARMLMQLWRRQAEKMEMLRDLADIRADMTFALYQDALKELERVRGLQK